MDSKTFSTKKQMTVAKKRSISKSSTPKKLTTEQLQAQAEQNLLAHRFKAAIVDYKELVHREATPARLDGLADAYLGRSEELAAKGMVKEALMLYQNCMEICQREPDALRHFALLLALPQPAAAQEWLQQRLATWEEKTPQREQIRRYCAAQILAGRHELLTPWPEDDPLRRDLPLAEQILDGYCNGDDAAVESALGALRFRSPFRELKPLFRALLALPEHSAQARQHLAKIAADSPYIPLVTAIQHSFNPQLLQQQDDPIPAAVRAFAGALQGWNQSIDHAAGDFIRWERGNKPKTLGSIIKQHRQLLGESFVREALKRILLHPELSGFFSALSKKQIERLLGDLSDFEYQQLAALQCEVSQQSLPYITHRWQSALSALSKDLHPFTPEEKPLIEALIYRHLAQSTSDKTTPSKTNLAQITEWLTLALDRDPDDHAAALQLIALHRDHNNLKSAREVAAKAEQHWPNDPALLTQLVRNAVAGGAYKKAARIARQLLALDSVNHEIKQVLLHAHLAHAHKQLAQSDKHHLVLNELQEALQWADNALDRGKIAQLSGVHAWLDGDTKSARQQITEGCLAIGPLLGPFILLLSGIKLHLDRKALLRLTPFTTKQPFNAPELFSLLQEVDSALQREKPKAVEQALAPLLPLLKQRTNFSLDEAQWVLLCERVAANPLLSPELLQRYLENAQKQFPNSLTLRYLKLTALPKSQRLPSFILIQQLERLGEEAEQSNDHRLVSRIHHSIEELYHDTLPHFYADSYLEEEEAEDDDDAYRMEDLFPQLREANDPRSAIKSLLLEANFIPPEELSLPDGMTLDEFVEHLLEFPNQPPEMESFLEMFAPLFGENGRHEVLKLFVEIGMKGKPGKR